MEAVTVEVEALTASVQNGFARVCAHACVRLCSCHGLQWNLRIRHPAALCIR